MAIKYHKAIKSLAEVLGFEPRRTPSEGQGFRDPCADRYTTPQYNWRQTEVSIPKGY